MITLKTALQIYLQIDRSEVTNHNYLTFLGKVVKNLGEDRPVSNVTLAELVDYTATLKERLKPGTYSTYMVMLKMFFRWCVDNHYCEHNPAAGLKSRKPYKGDNVNRAMPPDVLQALLDATRHKARDYAILMFLADTGCRAGGLVSLRLSNLNLEDGSAILNEKGDRRHKVYFSAETTEALRRWLVKRPSCEHDYVFTRRIKHSSPPLLPASVTKFMGRLTTEMFGKAYGPHSIRHAVGHALAKAGVPVTVTQKKLGHANPAITMSVYYPDDEAFVRGVLEQHPLAALEGATPKAEKEKIIRPDFGKFGS